MSQNLPICFTNRVFVPTYSFEAIGSVGSTGKLSNLFQQFGDAHEELHKLQLERIKPERKKTQKQNCHIYLQAGIYTERIPNELKLHW